ncbi:hypothetical protein, partial [Plesiomonas shigelloides]|uniref:hypothetical protein n=1 Tax=Plesiomonas shigelloides TaxID=703 RepID=UPI001E4FFA65
GLVNEGYADWTHVAVRLQEHEVGLEHKKNWATWYELRSRSNVNKTVDHLAQKQLKKKGSLEKCFVQNNLYCEISCKT